MKITLNTDTKIIRDKRTKTDRNKSQRQQEAERMEILAFAVAASAMRYFKTEKARKLYVDELAGIAKRMITGMSKPS